MKKRFILFLAVLILELSQVFAQSNTLHVRIIDLPYNKVAIGYMHGDRFVLCDSLNTSNIVSGNVPLKLVSWTFPSDAQTGMYRIVFGYTTYARVMDEAPQQLDFIYIREDIRLQTDFKAPADSVKVISSEENRAWFSFLKREQEFRKKLKELEKEVNYYQDKISGFKANSKNQVPVVYEEKVATVANAFNLLQMERETFVANAAAEHSHLFAARMINTFHEPFRDGYLSASERKASFQKEYFRYIDFSDESLINTTVFTDKIFSYLVTFNRHDFTKAQREDAYIPAVDAVMAAVKKSTGNTGPVYEFVTDYLVDGFERLSMDKVLTWIADKY